MLWPSLVPERWKRQKRVQDSQTSIKKKVFRGKKPPRLVVGLAQMCFSSLGS
jgi:hypothetical protein